MMRRYFATDCEGPISRNDNAQELTAHLVPQGKAFFAIISKYDDFLADVVKKPGYKAGDTLKLILPFLIAFGADNGNVQRFSRSHIRLMPGAVETLRFLRKRMPTCMISTSYEPYVRALCDAIGFPLDHVVCTSIDLDKYVLDREEQSWLREALTEIVEMEPPQWPEDAGHITEVSESHQRTVKRLDSIFWETIPKMKIGRVLDEIRPIGGPEKIKALIRRLEAVECTLENAMYVGDSITDVQALERVRENGGLAVSFNGNGYALRSSHICCMSHDARIMAVLADVFNTGGRDETLQMARSWAPENIHRFQVDRELLDWLNTLSQRDFPRLEQISESNCRGLISTSEAFRKSVRGESIGALG